MSFRVEAATPAIAKFAAAMMVAAFVFAWAGGGPLAILAAAAGLLGSRGVTVTRTRR